MSFLFSVDSASGFFGFAVASAPERGVSGPSGVSIDPASYGDICSSELICDACGSPSLSSGSN